ncbi:MAG: ATP-binding cassette domain-containing protein [Chloroflexi bacterium]|nr:ATP-binding cassette domain-containing protein [Chloroflexota bacterium]
MAQDNLPRLRVTSPAGEQTYTLDRAVYSIGRTPDNDICVPVETVSGKHARLVREGSTYRYIQLGHTNPTLLEGSPVFEHLLRAGDRLEIGSGADAVVMHFDSQAASHTVLASSQTLTGAPIKPSETQPTGVARLTLPAQGSIHIGRAETSDLELPSLHVSRQHARIELQDGRATLSDSGSSNGTFVNGIRTSSRILAAGDVVRIGPYKLVFTGDAIEHIDDSKRVRLDAHNVSKTVGAAVLLDNVSFVAQPGEVLVIAGTSGAGKSTLLDALNGSRPPTSGHVLVNGADLYRAYDALRPLIGYVPQHTILPEQLPLRRALRYVASLRLPPDVSGEEADRRVDDVMRQLDLDRSPDLPIGNLSGGQQKRASIAAELISDPGLFFLDEPTSGLDPGLTQRVNEIVAKLASGGATIVMISHDVESLLAADRILMLGSGGRVVFAGSPHDALVYYQVDNFAEIYHRVEGEDSATLRSRLLESEYYKNEVAPSLVQPDTAVEDDDGAGATWDPAALIGGSVRRGSSGWRQLGIVTTRYMDTLFRDRGHLFLLLAQAPIIAFFLAIVAQASDLQPPPPAAVEVAEGLGVSVAALAGPLALMMAATATWFGAFNAAQEIVKELPIFLRERMAGLRVAPYLASKLAVLFALGLVQTTVLLGIVALQVDLPSSGAILWGPLELWITLNLAAFAALGLGLFISASVSNPDRAQSLVPIVLIPQLLFVGGPGTGAVGQILSYFTVTHWTVEAMKISAEIPYATGVSGFAAEDLLFRWGALTLMAVVLLTLTAVQVARRRSA